jgi:hypothetical protein
VIDYVDSDKYFRNQYDVYADCRELCDRGFRLKKIPCRQIPEDGTPSSGFLFIQT